MLSTQRGVKKMTDEDLEKANELREQIRELSLFLLTARKVWTGKMVIIKPRPRLCFVTNAYGVFRSEEFELNNKLKNKVVEVLENELVELKNELDAI